MFGLQDLVGLLNEAKRHRRASKVRVCPPHSLPPTPHHLHPLHRGLRPQKVVSLITGQHVTSLTQHQSQASHDSEEDLAYGSYPV